MSNTPVPTAGADFERELSSLTKALGHPARIRILRLLAERSGCVCGTIVDEIGLVAKCSDVSDLKLQLEKMILDPQLIEIGKKSRNKILEDFSINKMVSKTEDEIIKINQAVELLALQDPMLGTHLMKLADLARKDPAQYKMMLTMLNAL